MARNLTAAAIILLLTTNAQAATLFSGWMNAPDNGGFVNCTITNLDNDPVTARVVGLEGAGSVLFDTGNFTLGAGASSGINGPTSLSTRCEFTANTRRQRIRGVIRATNSAGEPVAALDAR